MRTAATALFKALQSGRPLVVVFYEELSSRDQLISEIEILAPEGVSVERTEDIERAFQEPQRVLLLTPPNEKTALETLDGRREMLRERTRPAVLFLLKGGEAERALPEVPGLASWLQGQEIDPDELSSIDIVAERARFQEETGKAPEERLSRGSNRSSAPAPPEPPYASCAARAGRTGRVK